MDVTFLECETYFSAPTCNSPHEREIQSQENNWQSLITVDSCFDNQQSHDALVESNDNLVERHNASVGSIDNLVENYHVSVESSDNVVTNIELEEPPLPVPNDHSPEST